MKRLYVTDADIRDVIVILRRYRDAAPDDYAETVADYIYASPASETMNPILAAAFPEIARDARK